MTSFEEKKAPLSQAARSATEGRLRLGKDTSNLFRDRQEVRAARLDVRSLNELLSVDAERLSVDTEAMVPYDALVDETLAHGVMPPVVPQLKSITIGGAVAGLGIESGSFRHGLVHDMVEELEVLLPGGETVPCTSTNEHSDLFFGFPNSFGTLGYALRVKTGAICTKPHVRLRHIRYHDSETCFAEL